MFFFPEKMETVAGTAFRSTDNEGKSSVNGVEIMGTVVGEDEVNGISPQALRVKVPAPMPINLMKSLRVIVFFEVICSIQYSLTV